MRISRAWILIAAAVALIAAAAIALTNTDWTRTDADADSVIPAEAGIQTYRSDKFGFTFEYSGAQITEFKEGETYVILLTTNLPAGDLPKGDNQQPTTRQLQISITPFDEDIVLTAERIRADLPDMPMQDARPARLGKAEGVFFIVGSPTSEEPSEVGLPTIELWAVWNGYLYQLKARVEDAALLEVIAKGWEN